MSATQFAFPETHEQYKELDRRRTGDYAPAINDPNHQWDLQLAVGMIKSFVVARPGSLVDVGHNTLDDTSFWRYRFERHNDLHLREYEIDVTDSKPETNILEKYTVTSKTFVEGSLMYAHYFALKRLNNGVYGLGYVNGTTDLASQVDRSPIRIESEALFDELVEIDKIVSNIQT